MGDDPREKKVEGLSHQEKNISVIHLLQFKYIGGKLLVLRGSAFMDNCVLYHSLHIISNIGGLLRFKSSA